MKRILTVMMILCPTFSHADWVQKQTNGFARASTNSGNYELILSCRRGDGNLEMTILDKSLSGRAFQGLQGVMMWIELSDGRTHRQPVDVVMEGPSISGTFYVSDFVMDFYQNAVSYVVDMPSRGGEDLMRGNMRGSGAARLAFLEQCGL
ncbi:MAG: hypothetical protein WBB25_08040 [Sulfitobacter sp.]